MGPGSSPSSGNGGAGVPTFNTIVWSLTRPHPAGFWAARWLILRGLGVVFFSAFHSYAFQIQGSFPRPSGGQRTFSSPFALPMAMACSP